MRVYNIDFFVYSKNLLHNFFYLIYVLINITRMAEMGFKQFYRDELKFKLWKKNR